MTRAALGLGLIAAISLGVYFGLRGQAAPEHRVPFALSRDQAEINAARFVADTFGGDLSTDWRATTFTVDTRAKTYVEKELGVAETTRLATDADLWYFNTRFFRPLRKEEWYVATSPDGRIVGYRHLLDEAAVGARLGRDAALERATTWLERLGFRADGLRLIESSTFDRPGRTDWRFTWERPLTSSAAVTRVRVVLLGDELGAVQRFLWVPEDWERQYLSIRSQNAAAQTAATVLGLLPLILAMMVVFVVAFARRDLRLRAPLALGAVAGVLSVVSVVNELPLSLMRMPTTTTWETFVSDQIVASALGGVAQGLLVFLAAASGDWVYRRRLPTLPSLGASLSGGAGFGGSTRALAIGAACAFAVAAYQVVYYVAGRAIGVWTPADVPYEDFHSALAPWLLPLTVAYQAATFEELALRVFPIPLLSWGLARVIGRPKLALWIAIVLSAVVWGFLHSAYPQDPFYARGVEVALIGVLFGWLVVRFGIAAALSAHFSFNGFVAAVALLDGPSPVTAVIGGLVAAAGLGVMFVLLPLVRRRRGASPADRSLHPAVQTAADALAAAGGAAAHRAGWAYPQLSTRRRLFALGLASGGLLLHLTLGTGGPPNQSFRFDRDEAVRRADAHLLAAGVDPGNYERITTVETRVDDLSREYIEEHVGRQAVRALYSEIIPDVLWQVRYVRPFQRDEYRVHLLPNTPARWPPLAVVHDLAEASPGGRPTLEEARRLASARIAATPGWVGVPVRVVDEGTAVRPNRLDYRFVFERSDISLAEATVRVEIGVIGWHASGFRPFVKLPEEWLRKRTATSPRDVAALALRGALALVLLALATLAFLRLARAGQLALKPAAIVAVGCATWALVGELNALPLLFRAYYSALPPPTYVLTRLARDGVDIVQESLLAAAAAALVIGLWRQQIAPAIVPTINRGGWVFDGALLSASMALALLGLLAAVDAAGLGTAAAAAVGVGWEAPTGAATLFPALASVAEARWVALRTLVLFGGYLLVRGALKRDRWTLVAALLLPGLSVFGARTPSRALEGLLIILALVGVAMAARWLLRANLPAYFGATFLLVLVVDSEGMLQHQYWWYEANGLALLGAVAVAVIAIGAAGLPIARGDLGARQDTRA